MRLNTAQAKPKIFTHEGGVAKHISDADALRRSVLSCLLWEGTFYESGEDIAARIERLADARPKEEVARLAVEAREDFNLRHVPLLLLRSLIAKGGEGVADTIAQVIQRPDEMTELLAIYWKDGRKPLSKQLQRGLAKSFGKFDEYQLAKYDRDGPIRLRDVLFLSHAKPTDEALYKRVADRELKTPDTWEVGLSGGGDKAETFTRLLSEQKLGYLALLRNLRNMADAGVDVGLIRDAILAHRGAHRVLPFRYLAAAQACPQMEPYLDEALLEAVASGPRLEGRTVVAVDVSGSMNARLSSRSEMTRADAAATLASVINGDVRVLAFASDVMEVAPRKGLAGVDAIRSAVGRIGYGTEMGRAVHQANKMGADRIIVISDEQTRDRVPDPVCDLAYGVNVAPYRNGVTYGRWTHIDGFSETVLRFIHEAERER